MADKKARFEVRDILPIALSIVVAGIGIAYGLNVMGDVRSDMGTTECAGYFNPVSGNCEVSATNSTVLSGNSDAVNATGSAITAVAKFPSKLGLIVTVIVAAILIGLLVRYLMVR